MAALYDVVLFTTSSSPSRPAVVNPDGSGLKIIPDSSDAWEWVVGSRDGTTLAGQTGDDAGPVLISVDGMNRRVLTSIPSDWSGVTPMAFSPDGSRLAGLRTPDDGDPATWEVVIINTDNSGWHGIGLGAATIFPLCWSPDGSKLAFRTPNGSGITQCNPDGSGRSDIVDPISSDFVVLDYFPDSQHVLVRDRAEYTFIKADIAAGTFPVIFSDGFGSGITNEDGGAGLSPDGTKVAFDSATPVYPDNGLGVLNLETGRAELIIDPSISGRPTVPYFRISWLGPTPPSTIVAGPHTTGLIPLSRR